MKILSFINILCFSNKAINPTALKGLFSSSIPAPCFSLVISACNISMTLQHRATSVCAQGSSLHSWSNTRRKHVALVLRVLLQTLLQMWDSQQTRTKWSFPTDCRKLQTLEAFLKELSSHPSAAWSATFKHLNSVFRPKRSITLSQALHFIHSPCTETSLETF